MDPDDSESTKKLKLSMLEQYLKVLCQLLLTLVLLIVMKKIKFNYKEVAPKIRLG